MKQQLVQPQLHFLDKYILRHYKEILLCQSLQNMAEHVFSPVILSTESARLFAKLPTAVLVAPILSNLQDIFLSLHKENRYNQQ